MPWKTRYNDFAKLCVSRRYDIFNHVDSSWLHINYSNSEPEIIREYLSFGLGYLNTNLAPILSTSGYEIKFASVFIHQKPRITRLVPCPPNQRQCELGDLLVIFSFLDKNKTPLLNRAFLSQAKKDLTIANICQKSLYDEDTRFDFPNSIYLKSPCCDNSPTRYFPSLIYKRWRSLKYLILPPAVTNPTIFISPWDIQISADWSFGFLGLLTGFDGLHFSTSPTPGQRWSAIIWDLISVVAPSIVGGAARGNDLQWIANAFNEFRNNKEFFRESEKDSGLSTIFVLVKDLESTSES